jgi:hypothetical protein
MTLQPIESAPKDGTWVFGMESYNGKALLWGRMQFVERTYGRYTTACWTDGEYAYNPSVWAPIEPTGV